MSYSEAKIQTDLPLKYIIHSSAEAKNKPLIIFLHGFTRTEQDIYIMKDSFVPDYTYLSVQAPLPIYSGYQWFSLQLPAGGLIQIAEEVKNSSKLLERFIKAASIKYNTDSEKIFIVGFSQGAMMTYELALRKPELVRGIVTLSGGMLPIIQNIMKPGHDLKNLAVFIGHGVKDNRVPVEAAISANETLRKTSITPIFHTYDDLGHTINNKELTDINQWIKTILVTPRQIIRPVSINP